MTHTFNRLGLPPAKPLAPRKGWHIWQLPSIEQSHTISDADAPEVMEPGALKHDPQQLELERQAQARAEHEAQCEAQRSEAAKRGFDEGYSTGLEQGREKGLQEGLAQAKIQADAALEEKVAALDQLAQSWAKDLNTLGDEVGQHLIALSLRIAGTVVRRTYDHAPQWAASLVDEILSQSEPATALTFHVSPQDCAIIEAHLSACHKKRDWQIVQDPGIEPGGCKVVSQFGQVDATISGRLARAAQAFGFECSETGALT